MRVLVTGAAGFIGFHVARKLLELGHSVTGIDNLSPYYDVNLKKDRLKQLALGEAAHNFNFEKIDMANGQELERIFRQGAFSHVINLAAQAGVRYGIQNPASYISSNLAGFANLLESCRASQIEHLVFASSSSVYGLNGSRPYSVDQNVDHPVSLYAATKKSNELLAHSYSHLFGLPATGLRFFTVYGPWGRPDMALTLFTNAILKGEPIKLFNNGDLQRDFTYIDDIVEGVIRALDKPPAPDANFDQVHPNPATSLAPWRIYNIGNSKTVSLGEFVAAIETGLGKKAIKELLPMQPGDVLSTLADVSDFYELTGFRPATELSKGIAEYIKWHKDYYGSNR